jgi:hypothetical protein
MREKFDLTVKTRGECRHDEYGSENIAIMISKIKGKRY